MNVFTTVVGFGMSVSFILLVFTRLICRKVRASATEPRSVFDAQTIAERVHTIHGLEPVVIASLPMTEFNNDATCPKEEAHCSICLGEYKDREKLRTLPACGHNFHLACIDIWLRRQSTCPICRLSLHRPSEARSTISRTFGGALHPVDTSEVVSDHSSQQLCSPGSSSTCEHDLEYQTFSGALQTVDTPEVVRDHSSQQLCSPGSSSTSEDDLEYQGSVHKNLEFEIAREAVIGIN